MSYWQRLNTRALLTKLGYSPIYVLISDALWLNWANPSLPIGERSERGQVLLLQLKIGKHRTAEKIGYKLGLMLQFPHE